MARTPDKPGTYRIRQKGFDYVLSGVTASGKRVKIPVTSQFEGEQLASTLFPQSAVSSNDPALPKVAPTFAGVDEWGLPIVTAESAQTVASAMGIPPTPTTAETDKKVAEAAAKQVERKKYAKSLMELAGHGYAVGVVMGSQRFVTSTGRVPVKPSPKQVTDLAEVTRDTLSEWFGDHEVKPWIMMVLLTVGIPLSMWIQSPKAKAKQIETSPESENPSGLRSVT
jgi:hypothetical protein